MRSKQTISPDPIMAHILTLGRWASGLQPEERPQDFLGFCSAITALAHASADGGPLHGWRASCVFYN